MSCQHCRSPSLPSQLLYLSTWSKCKFPSGSVHLSGLYLASQQFLVHLAILLVIHSFSTSHSPSSFSWTSGQWNAVLCLQPSSLIEGHRSVQWPTAAATGGSFVESVVRQTSSGQAAPNLHCPNCTHSHGQQQRQSEHTSQHEAAVRWTEQSKVPLQSSLQVRPLMLLTPSSLAVSVSLPLTNLPVSLPFARLELSLTADHLHLNLSTTLVPQFMSPEVIFAYHHLVEEAEHHTTEVHRTRGYSPQIVNMTAFLESLLANSTSPPSDSSEECHLFSGRIVSPNNMLVDEFRENSKVGDIDEPAKPNGSGPTTATYSSLPSTATFSLCSHGSLSGLVTLHPYGHLLVEPSTNKCSIEPSCNRTADCPVQWTKHSHQVVQSCEHQVRFMPFPLDHSQSNDESRRSQRVKRFISRERTIEILVVNDQSMLRYHKSKEALNTYVNTLMASVWHIFKHSSIGNEINIKLLESQILDDPREEYELFEQGVSAQGTLRKFCQWQYQYHQSAGLHHDIAILLTRRDLCRKNNDLHMASQSCDTIGLAHSGQICDPKSSCAIVEDTGLSAAFTIAHELGHVLGIPHDDEEKCKNFYANEGKHYHKLAESNVMARMIDVKSHMWSWSPCSRHFITEYLDSSKGDCLLDHSGQTRVDGYQQSSYQTDDSSSHHQQRSVFNWLVSQAGSAYDVNKQCQLMFGDRSRVCTDMPACKRLWCTHAGQGCRTQHIPWADGTSCGTDMWCQQGECVRVDHHAMRAINGGWGQWSPYSECSLPCGGGIKRSTRICDSPSPRNGGKFCLGKRTRYESCNIEPCDRDFRAEQCTKFNGQNFKIANVDSNVQWLPHHTRNPSEECKLYCADSRKGNYYQLKERVDDGTPCSPDSYDKCVNGRCLSAGCDLVLGSNATLDRCGVCRGDNSTCRELSGRFEARSVRHGYNLVVEIPAGASNIEVNKTDSTDNWLAIRADDASYLLNGQFIVNLYQRKWHYGGATIEYSGVNKSAKNGMERINSTRLIDRALFIEVLCVGNLIVPSIDYRYVVASNTRYEWYWDGKQWTECNKVCLGQHQQRFICTAVSTDRGSPESRTHVQEEYCRHLSPPPTKVQVCNDHCELVWHIEPSSQCSAQCGHGYRKRQIRCSQRLIRHRKFDNQHFIDDWYCEAEEPKPASSEPCIGTNCRIVPQWRYTAEWGQCQLPHNKICGEGSQTRVAQCVAADSLVSPEECKHLNLPEPVPTQTCRVACWVAGVWSECSGVCGIGEMHRKVTCWRGNQQESNEQLCLQVEPKPSEREPCNLPECPREPVYEPQFSSRSLPASGEELPEYNSVNSPFFADSRRKPSAIWHTGNWSECNITDILKSQIDKVPHCFNSGEEFLHLSAKFALLNRTFSAKNYTMLMWHFSLKEEVLLRSRHVACVTDLVKQAILNDEECNSTTRPKSEEYCPVFEKDVFQFPKLTANYCPNMPAPNSMPADLYHDQQDNAPSPVENKPTTEEMVGQTNPLSKERFEWGVGDWGQCQCNSSLRKYTHQRLVQCVRLLPQQSIAIISDEYCIRLLNQPRPVHRQQCTPKTGEDTHADCSGTTVSVSVQTRQVDSSLATSTSLSLAPTSSVTQMNTQTSTPTLRTTTTSVLEGPPLSMSSTVRQTVAPLASSLVPSQVMFTAHQSMAIESQAHYSKSLSMNARSEVMQDSAAMASPTPSLETFPQSVSVSQYLPKTSAPVPESASRVSPWQWPEWSKCSFQNGAKCGNGTQSRQPFCPETYRCRRTEKPATQVQPCWEVCPPNWQWHVSSWSACICGENMRRRKVQCRDWTDAQVGDHYCGDRVKPASTEKCQAKCEWRTGHWAECSKPCGEGVQLRPVTCHRINSYGHFDPRPLPEPTVQSALNRRKRGRAQPRSKQRSRRHAVSDRSSASMIDYNHQSRVSLPDKGQARHRKRHNHGYQAGTSYRTEARSSSPIWCDSSARPNDTLPCNLGHCLKPGLRDAFVWHPSPWSSCKLCGNGLQTRKINCLSLRKNVTVSRQFCDAKQRPERTRKCNLRTCDPISCQDIHDRGHDRNDHSYGRTDGEYDIKVQGATIKVYCYGMKSSSPVDYLILRSDENYSQRIYRPSCPSSHPSSERSSKLYFKYVRLNVTSLQIIINDTMFATMETKDSLSQSISRQYQDRDLVIDERSLAFGQALVHSCPDNDRNSIITGNGCAGARFGHQPTEWTQSLAGFSINLQSTGLILAPDTNWQRLGPDQLVYKHINRSKSGEKISGTCGVKGTSVGQLHSHNRRRTSWCEIGCQPSQGTIQLMVP